MNYQHLCNPKFWFCISKVLWNASCPVTIETEPSKTNSVVPCL